MTESAPSPLLQPMITSRWVTKFPDFPSEDRDILSRAIQEVSLPRAVRLPRASRNIIGETWSHAPGKMVFLNDIGGAVNRILREQIFRQMKSPEDFFKIGIYTVGESDSPPVEHRYYLGCSITELDYGTLNYAVVQPCMITVTFTYRETT